jgi:tetratricopeptide (TPR) repeat protein
MRTVPAHKRSARLPRFERRRALTLSALTLLVSMVLPCAPLARGFLSPAQLSAQLLAQDEPPESSPNLARGEYFMKAGKYLKASHAFRAAVLEDQTDPKRLLSFAASLFAVGNYHYSSHAIRRAARQVDGREPFRPNIVAMFPSRVAYMRALDELKRYVTYNRRDPLRPSPSSRSAITMKPMAP